MNKANPLSFQEHEELADAIRSFKGLFYSRVLGRYLKKSKIAQEQQVYGTSPYYGAVKEAK